MAPSQEEKLAWRYAKEMEHHSFGHACYHRTSSSILYPGAIGYFNTHGEWIRIASLQALQKPDLTRPGGIAKKFSSVDADMDLQPVFENMQWGPKMSVQTKRRGAGFGIEL